MFRLVCLLGVAFTGSVVSAFQGRSTTTSTWRSSSSRQRLVPTQFKMIPDPTTISQLSDQIVSSLSTTPAAATSHEVVLSALQQHYDMLMVDSTAVSQWLADASAAAEAPPIPTGWWGDYLLLFKNTLQWVHSIVDAPLRSVGIEQTWGVSILIFTAMVRSLLLPLSIQQSKSSEYMKVLKPYVSEIKQKFKDNQDAQNRAVAKLYEDAQQNPLAGCLVSLAQLPVFLGLYRGVRWLAYEDQLNEPFLWIPSLEGPVTAPKYQGMDWLLSGWTTVDGLPTPSLGWETTLAFLVMPVILVVLQSITMRVLSPPMDDNMSEEEKETFERSQVVLKFLPLLIGFFSLQVPAGLTIYWFTSNIFTLSQSLGVRAYYAANPPKINLPDYWETALKEDKDYSNMTPEERRKAIEAGIRIGPTMTDLIDEARFHCHIERPPVRPDTDAWNRVVQSNLMMSTTTTVVTELVKNRALQEWIQQGPTVMASGHDESKNGSSDGDSDNKDDKLFFAAEQKVSTASASSSSAGTATA